MASSSIYEKLERGEIRILTVRPGVYPVEDPAEPYCTLDRRKLDNSGGGKEASTQQDIPGGGEEASTQHDLSYDAVSYSWDEQQRDQPVYFKAGSVWVQYKVTKNVLGVLRDFWSPSGSKLWIDAICINQTDDAEKSDQLELMTQIYRNADNVRVWLGTPCADSGLAFGLVRKLRELEDFECVVEKKTIYEEWVAFIALLRRNWFSRRWVIQEVALARFVTLYCGAHTILWTEFAEAVTLSEIMMERVKAKFQKDVDYRQHPDVFGGIQELSASRLVALTSNIVRLGDKGQLVQKRWNLEALVSFLTPFQTSRPHDIIYAVLSLSRDVDKVFRQVQATKPPEPGDGPQISTARMPEKSQPPRDYPVSYEKKFGEVCKDFLDFVRTGSNSLDMICRPWAPVQTSERAPPLPSWVKTLAEAPFGRDLDGHWSRKSADSLVGLPDQNPYEASKSRKPNCNFEGNEGAPILRVEGFKLDTVNTVEDTAVGGVIPTSWLPYRSGGRADVDRFWRTVVAGRGADGRQPPLYYASACEKTLAAAVEHGDVNLGQIHDRSTNTLQKSFIKRVQSVVWGRRLVESKKGLLAVVPRSTKHGDHICILYGCSVPVVLRECSMGVSDSPLYEFIGESYVHGMMEGAAMEVKNQPDMFFKIK